MPAEREPTLRSVLINTVPERTESGESEVKILGVHGNDSSSETFTYTLPPQEFTLAKTSLFQLNIIDPIIKKEL